MAVATQRDLSAHLLPEPLSKRLRRLADVSESFAVDSPDVYGTCAALQAFEADLASLLGKSKGMFFPTGTLAQHAALNTHKEELLTKCRKSGRVIVHPTSHLVHHDCLRDAGAQVDRAENEAMERLPSFSVTFVGEFRRALSMEDFTAMPDGLSEGDVVVVELPQRMNGGRAMSWADLEALSKHAHAAGARLHMDGARLWEVQPFYGKSFKEICALFDSVYVSFYKGLGGMVGAMLCGREDFIDLAKQWRSRLGGDMYALAPHWIDAREQLRTRKDSFQALFEKLQSVVGALMADSSIAQVLRFEPPCPQSCMIHGYVAVKKLTEDESCEGALERAHQKVITATGVRLWNRLRGRGYGKESIANSESEMYFEMNMGPANGALPLEAFLEGWQAIAKELTAERDQ